MFMHWIENGEPISGLAVGVKIVHVILGIAAIEVVN